MGRVNKEASSDDQIVCNLLWRFKAVVPLWLLAPREVKLLPDSTYVTLACEDE